MEAQQSGMSLLGLSGPLPELVVEKFDAAVASQSLIFSETQSKLLKPEGMPNVRPDFQLLSTTLHLLTIARSCSDTVHRLTKSQGRTIQLLQTRTVNRPIRSLHHHQIC